MLQFLGFIVLAATIALSIFIVVETHSYLGAFIVFWIGLTIGSMMILKFKEQ